MSDSTQLADSFLFDSTTVLKQKAVDDKNDLHESGTVIIDLLKNGADCLWLIKS